MTTVSSLKSDNVAMGATPGSVLVTGASGGIGQAVSRAFGKAGWCVGVHYHKAKTPAEKCLSHIERAGGSGALYEADVRDAHAVQQMVSAFSRISPPPLCFVCAAGVSDEHLVLKLEEADWANVMAINLTGLFHCLRAMAVPLQKQGGGSIVVVGSYAGYRGTAGQAAYAASKAGLLGLVKSAALEWGSDNIRVNLIWPGWHKTNLAEKGLSHKIAWDDHALRRPPALEEVVRTIVHLAQLKDVSGQVWNCDSRFLGL
ncbi:MAG TPA: SDR family NAD(P)-dependent oxidoreductase [Nitrospira sp.]|nr:SDR family NAD(P)-dependent oxidoreductase [Nitrospira sp.]